MIAVQWVLSLLLVVAIIFVLLLFFVPAWLERQSRANVKQRQTLAEDIQTQERAARALERALIPYARGRSAHFVAGTAAARERLRNAGHEVYLMMEATIVLGDVEEDGDRQPFSALSVEQRLAEISHEDKQFLKGLNIKFDNDE